MAHAVKCPTLDFGSGHDLRLREISQLYADSAEPAWDPLSPSLSGPPLLAHMLSLSLFLSE